MTANRSTPEVVHERARGLGHAAQGAVGLGRGVAVAGAVDADQAQPPLARRRVPPPRQQTRARRAVVEDDCEPVWVAKLVDDRGTRQSASR